METSVNSIQILVYPRSRNKEIAYIYIEREDWNRSSNGWITCRQWTCRWGCRSQNSPSWSVELWGGHSVGTPSRPNSYAGWHQGYGMGREDYCRSWAVKLWPLWGGSCKGLLSLAGLPAGSCLSHTSVLLAVQTQLLLSYLGSPPSSSICTLELSISWKKPTI